MGKRTRDEVNEELEEEDLIVLEDEQGNEVKFRLVFDSLFIGERQYVVLMPVDENGEYEPELVILRVEEEDGEISLVTIDDDDEWEEVLEAFEEMELEKNLGDYEIEVEEDEDEEEPEEEETEE